MPLFLTLLGLVGGATAIAGAIGLTAPPMQSGDIVLWQICYTLWFGFGLLATIGGFGGGFTLLRLNQIRARLRPEAGRSEKIASAGGSTRREPSFQTRQKPLLSETGLK